MHTLRYYTDSGKYMGNVYPQKANYSEVLNWLRSGNYIMYKNIDIDISWTVANFNVAIFRDTIAKLIELNKIECN